MEVITLQISEVERSELDQCARDLGLSAEELVRRSLMRVLSPTKLSFEEALQYTLEKNAELYRRLA